MQNPAVTVCSIDVNKTAVPVEMCFNQVGLLSVICVQTLAAVCNARPSRCAKYVMQEQIGLQYVAMKKLNVICHYLS